MSPYSTEPALDERTLLRVADLRARGTSWEATARAVGWEVFELRQAVRRESEFETLYQEAEREVRREAEAEMLLTFRTQMRDPDLAVARKGAEALAKLTIAERRERTRLEVERMRADVAREKLAAKRPAAEPEPAPPPAQELAPEEVHRPDLEDLYARRAANDRAVVWLWGGTHKVGGTEPDAATDTPLVLFADSTVPGRKLYWATRFPLPGDPLNGPFPAPAQEPTPEPTAEQLRQLKALANGCECTT